MSISSTSGLPTSSLELMDPRTREEREQAFIDETERVRSSRLRSIDGRKLAENLVGLAHDHDSSAPEHIYNRSIRVMSQFLIASIADGKRDAERVYQELMASLASLVKTDHPDQAPTILQAMLIGVAIESLRDEIDNLRASARGKSRHGRLALILCVMINAILSDRQKHRLVALLRELNYESPTGYSHPFIEDLLIKFQRSQSSKSVRMMEYGDSL